jgi:hypothetical protein
MAQRKIVKLEESSQVDLLQRQRLTSGNADTLPPQPSRSSTSPIRTCVSLQERGAAKGAVDESLVRKESVAIPDLEASRPRLDTLEWCTSPPQPMKDNAEQSITEATVSRPPKLSIYTKDHNDKERTASATPNVTDSPSIGMLQALPFQARPLPAANSDSNSLSWEFGKETSCDDKLEIPSVGTKEYDRYIDARLEGYRVETAVKAKRAKEVIKTPSEDPTRTRLSKGLVAFTVSLLTYSQDQRRRFHIHNKNVQDLTEEEFAIVLTRLPPRPLLPPMIGHEIAAKVHLEVSRTFSTRS